MEPGIKFSSLTAKIGYEVLSGDGTDAFQTPLATGHAFNGITDKFLTTPDDGLEDIYVKAAYSFAKVPLVEKISLAAAYHDFEADRGGADYGSEWST